MKHKKPVSPERNRAPEHEARDLAKLLQHMDTPLLSPSRKVQMFEAAWKQASHRPRWNWRETVAALLVRPAFPFAGGIAFGMVLTLMLVGSGQSSLPPLDAVPESHADVEVTDYVFFETVTGNLVRQAYPHIEDPVIVNEKPTAEFPQSRRAVHGTMNNGQVKIVWNL